MRLFPVECEGRPRERRRPSPEATRSVSCQPEGRRFYAMDFGGAGGPTLRWLGCSPDVS